MKQIARKAMVSGKVQGVWYRAWTQQQAHDLKIRGYAKNLPDGRVEVVMLGLPEAVDQMIERLKQGPPAALVTSVTSESVTPKPFTDFTKG